MKTFDVLTLKQIILMLLHFDTLNIVEFDAVALSNLIYSLNRLF
jgi:hypothetical protein